MYFFAFQIDMPCQKPTYYARYGPQPPPAPTLRRGENE